MKKRPEVEITHDDLMEVFAWGGDFQEMPDILVQMSQVSPHLHRAIQTYRNAHHPDGMRVEMAGALAMTILRMIADVEVTDRPDGERDPRKRHKALRKDMGVTDE